MPFHFVFVILAISTRLERTASVLLILDSVVVVVVVVAGVLVSRGCSLISQARNH